MSAFGGKADITAKLLSKADRGEHPEAAGIIAQGLMLLFLSLPALGH
jgi:hypothetical protein